jgi:hypothetical protein
MHRGINSNEPIELEVTVTAHKWHLFKEDKAGDMKDIAAASIEFSLFIGPSFGPQAIGPALHISLLKLPISVMGISNWVQWAQKRRPRRSVKSDTFSR